MRGRAEARSDRAEDRALHPDRRRDQDEERRQCFERVGDRPERDAGDDAGGGAQEEGAESLAKRASFGEQVRPQTPRTTARRQRADGATDAWLLDSHNGTLTRLIFRADTGRTGGSMLPPRRERQAS